MMNFKLEWNNGLGIIRLIFEIDGKTHIVPMEEEIIKKLLNFD